MANRLFQSIFVLVFLSVCQYAFAGYETGQELLIDCTGAYKDSAESSAGPLYCLGYVDGILDAHALLSSAHPEAKYFCAPDIGISAGVAMDITTLYIQKNPEARSMPARIVVIKALQEKYPCK